MKRSQLREANEAMTMLYANYRRMTFWYKYAIELLRIPSPCGDICVQLILTDAAYVLPALIKRCIL